MTPSVSQQQKAMIAVLRAAGRLRRQFGTVVQDHGLSASQYNVLRILRGAKGALPIMTIRDRMMDPEPSITRLVDRLEEQGLVERHRNLDDRRCVECRLTNNGLDLVNGLDEPVDRMDRALMAGLTRAELGILTELIEKVGVKA